MSKAAIIIDNVAGDDEDRGFALDYKVPKINEEDLNP